VRLKPKGELKKHILGREKHHQYNSITGLYSNKAQNGKRRSKKAESPNRNRKSNEVKAPRLRSGRATIGTSEKEKKKTEPEITRNSQNVFTSWFTRTNKTQRTKTRKAQTLYLKKRKTDFSCLSKNKLQVKKKKKKRITETFQRR